MSSRGMAAQFTATNGPSARALLEWILCAKISLPVPVSPCSSAVELLVAASRARRMASFKAGLSPTTLAKVRRARAGHTVDQFLHALDAAQDHHKAIRRHRLRNHQARGTDDIFQPRLRAI